MISTSIATLDRIRSKEEFAELCERAKADSHGIYTPTQLVRKNGEIVGYVSMAAHPHLLGWFQRGGVLTARDTIGIINSVEAVLAVAGHTHVAMPMPERSPFHALMPRLGYKKVDDYTYFVKEL